MPAAIERARHSEQAEKSEKEQDVPSKVLAVVKPTASPASPMKHPLEHKWALWWYKNDRALSWEENQKIVSSFDTIEDFWALLHHIEKASNLDSGCDYSLFKAGVKPMWEDSQNRNGGRWLANFHRSQRQSNLDRVWLEVLLCLIGGAFDQHSHLVNGAVVNVRNRGDKVALWMGDVSDSDAVLTAGKVLKSRMDMDRTEQIAFEAHQETMKKTGSQAKSKYVL